MSCAGRRLMRARVTAFARPTPISHLHEARCYQNTRVSHRSATLFPHRGVALPSSVRQYFQLAQDVDRSIRGPAKSRQKEPDKGRSSFLIGISCKTLDGLPLENYTSFLAYFACTPVSWIKFKKYPIGTKVPGTGNNGRRTFQHCAFAGFEKQSYPQEISRNLNDIVFNVILETSGGKALMMHHEVQPPDPFDGDSEELVVLRGLAPPYRPVDMDQGRLLQYISRTFEEKPGHLRILGEDIMSQGVQTYAKNGALKELRLERLKETWPDRTVVTTRLKGMLQLWFEWATDAVLTRVRAILSGDAIPALCGRLASLWTPQLKPLPAAPRSCRPSEKTEFEEGLFPQAQDNHELRDRTSVYVGDAFSAQVEQANKKGRVLIGFFETFFREDQFDEVYCVSSSANNDTLDRRANLDGPVYRNPLFSMRRLIREDLKKPDPIEALLREVAEVKDRLRILKLQVAQLEGHVDAAPHPTTLTGGDAEGLSTHGRTDGCEVLPLQEHVSDEGCDRRLEIVKKSNGVKATKDGDENDVPAAWRGVWETSGWVESARMQSKSEGLAMPITAAKLRSLDASFEYAKTTSELVKRAHKKESQTDCVRNDGGSRTSEVMGTSNHLGKATVEAQRVLETRKRELGVGQRDQLVARQAATKKQRNYAEERLLRQANKAKAAVDRAKVAQVWLPNLVERVKAAQALVKGNSTDLQDPSTLSKNAAKRKEAQAKKQVRDRRFDLDGQNWWVS